MEMKILRHEAVNFENTRTLWGIAIEVKGVGVAHLNNPALSASPLFVLKHIAINWRDPYTGHRKLKLNTAWQ